MSDRATKLRRAYRRGLRDGMASAFNMGGHNAPAPALIRRTQGSLTGDMENLKRDSERLLAGR